MDKDKIEKIVFDVLNTFEYEIMSEEYDNVADKIAEAVVKNCSIPNVGLSLLDIRNKLSPFKNLIAMLENGLMKGTIEVHPYIQKEIEQCKKSIAYLSRNKA